MATKTKLTQKQKILNRLSRGGTLTQVQATKMGITSVSSRMNELRKDGHPIVTTPYRNAQKRMAARYSMPA
jgi:hypothetical protein